jgi:hypothetical protein
MAGLEGPVLRSILHGVRNGMYYGVKVRHHYNYHHHQLFLPVCPRCSSALAVGSGPVSRPLVAVRSGCRMPSS